MGAEAGGGVAGSGSVTAPPVTVGEGIAAVSVNAAGASVEDGAVTRERGAVTREGVAAAGAVCERGGAVEG